MTLRSGDCGKPFEYSELNPIEQLWNVKLTNLQQLCDVHVNMEQNL